MISRCPENSSMSLVLLMLHIASVMAYDFPHIKRFYPEYCSIPSDMARRSIPPLNATYAPTGITLETQLLQATVLIRHGARTPCAALKCWEGYETKWDCNLTTLMAPTKRPNKNDDNNDQESSRSLFLFEKRYDALQAPLSNVLNGTCLLGQLIDEGYMQELQNGRFLRSAYITTPHATQQLLESTYYNQLPYTNAVYIRADDEQRTLMSGQILFRGLFDVTSDTIVSIHTADYSRDVLYPREDQCPILKELKEQSYASDEYRQAYDNPAVQELLTVFTNGTLSWINDDDKRADAASHVKSPQRYTRVTDCLMSTYCTDQHDSIPDVLWSGGPLKAKVEGVTDNDGSLFSRLYDFVSSC